MIRRQFIVIFSIIFLLCNIPVVQAQNYKKVQATVKYTDRSKNSTLPITQPEQMKNMTNYQMSWRNFSDPLQKHRKAWWKFEETKGNITIDSERDIEGNLSGNLTDLDIAGKDGSGLEMGRSLNQNGEMYVEPIIFDDTSKNRTDFNYVNPEPNDPSNATVSLWVNGEYYQNPVNTKNASIYLVDTKNSNFTAEIIVHPSNQCQLKLTIKRKNGINKIAKTENFTFENRYQQVTFSASLDKDLTIYKEGTELSYKVRENLDGGFFVERWDINFVGNIYLTSQIDDLRFYDIYPESSEIYDAYNRPKGITSTAFLPPSKATIENVTGTQSFVQYTQFDREEVLSGSSISWWRAPFQRISDQQKIKLTLYRSDSMRLANVSYSDNTDSDGWYNTSVSEVAHPSKIYEQTYDISDPDQKNKYLYTQNINQTHTWNGTKYNETSNETVENTQNKTFKYNFTYVKVFAPIKLMKSCLAVWQVQDDWTQSPYQSQNVYLTQSDTSKDGHTESIWQINTTTDGKVRYDFDGQKYPSVNLLTDVLFEYGMADNFAGIKSGYKNKEYDNRRKMFETTKYVDLTGDYNLTVSFPFISQENVSLRIKVDVWNGSGVRKTILSTSKNESEYLFWSIDLTTFSDINSFSKNKVNIQIDSNRSLRYWLEDRHDFTSSYSYSSSTVRLRNEELRKIGFDPFVTVEATPDVVEGSLPKSIDDILASHRRTQQEKTQETQLTIGEKIVEITGAGAIVDGASWATEATLDTLRDVGRFIKDQLGDFTDWALDELSGLDMIGSAIIETLDWLVRWSSWLFMTFLQSQLINWAFILFMTTVLLSFKLKNYFVILAREGFDDANEYVASKVSSAISTATAVIGAVTGRFGNGGGNQ